MIAPRLGAQLGLLSAFAVLALSASIIVAGAFEKPDQRTGLPGSEAIAFRLPDLDGQIVTLSSMRGNVVVLCFAPANESESANASMNRMAEIGRQYASNSNVKLTCIYSEPKSLAYEEQIRDIRQRAPDAGSNCTALLDIGSELAKRYGIEEMPTFLIIDPAGVVRYRGGIDDPSGNAPLALISFPSMIDLMLPQTPQQSSQSTPAVLSNINK